MSKRLPTLGSVLCYGGLFVSVAGFLGDKAENFPWAMRLLAGKYVRAEIALETLQKSGSLVPGQIGFLELERIFRDDLRRDPLAEPNLHQPTFNQSGFALSGWSVLSVITYNYRNYVTIFKDELSSTA
jgi:hypothetical protein